MKFKVGDKVKFYDDIFSMYPIVGQVLKVNPEEKTYEVSVQTVTVDEDNLVGE